MAYIDVSPLSVVQPLSSNELRPDHRTLESPKQGPRRASGAACGCLTCLDLVPVTSRCAHSAGHCLFTSGAFGLGPKVDLDFVGAVPARRAAPPRLQFGQCCMSMSNTGLSSRAELNPARSMNSLSAAGGGRLFVAESRGSPSVHERTHRPPQMIVDEPRRTRRPKLDSATI